MHSTQKESDMTGNISKTLGLKYAINLILSIRETRYGVVEHLDTHYVRVIDCISLKVISLHHAKKAKYVLYNKICDVLDGPSKTLW